MYVANSQSEVSEGSEEEEEEKVEEEEEEEESDDESEGEGGREETDAPHFIPFSNRSNITSELCAHLTRRVFCCYIPQPGVYALSAHSFSSI